LKIEVLEDHDAAAARGAELIAEAAREAVESEGAFAFTPADVGSNRIDLGREAATWRRIRRSGTKPVARYSVTVRPPSSALAEARAMRSTAAIGAR